MASQHLELIQTSTKSPAELYALLSDHEALSQVFGTRVHRVVDGQGHANGVGSVRRFRAGPMTLEETVTALEPNARIAYRISKGGGPVRNHGGEIRILDEGGETRVVWTIRFDAPPVVGAVIKHSLGFVLGRGLARIA